MKKRKRERERDEAMAREDHRTKKVLARLEASSQRYDRAVKRVEEKVKEIRDPDGGLTA